MARKREGDSDDESPRSKRRRLSGNAVVPKPKEDIRSAQDLHALLSPVDVDGATCLSNVKTFHTFLDGLFNKKDAGNEVTLVGHRAILLEYLKSQTKELEAAVPNLDLLKLWHKSVHINFENLFSSIAGTLALLLKVTSTLHEFRDVGNIVCKIVLTVDNITLINHGLSASKVREHLIAPCLRLLKEVVQFDGGKAAKPLYRSRDITLQRMEVFLSMKGNADTKTQSSSRRPSVRSLAIEYLMLNIGLQGKIAKTSLLTEHRCMKILFQDLNEDPSSIVLQVLSTLRSEVAQDLLVPLWVKSRLFNEWSLSRLALLYGYEKSRSKGKSDLRVPKLLHDLLMCLCASPEYGLVAIAQKNHKTFSPGEADGDVDSSLEEGSQDERAQSTKRIFEIVRKSTSTLLRNIRPYATLKQGDLLLASLRAFPSMSSEYFEKAESSFDPTLTASWIGQSRVLLAFLREPISKEHVLKVLQRDENQIACILDITLPPTISQKSMTRCLNQSCALIKIQAARILTAAFQKFIAIKGIVTNNRALDGVTNPSEIARKISSLTRLFWERCPKVKVIITQLRSCSEDSNLLRQSLVQLLALCYELSPEIAIEEQFDVSPALLNLLCDLELVDIESIEDGMRLIQLDHLVQIASKSPGMRWWTRPQSRPYTTFTALLRLFVAGRRKGREEGTGHILENILIQNFIVSPGGASSAFDALVKSLRKVPSTSARNRVYRFLDICFQRLSNRSIHYADVLTSLSTGITNSSKATTTQKADLLLVAAAEQLYHLGDHEDTSELLAVTSWYKSLLQLSLHRGVDLDLIRRIYDGFSDTRIGKDYGLTPEIISMEVLDKQNVHEPSLQSETGEDSRGHIPHTAQESTQSTGLGTLPGLIKEDERHPGLTKWAREEASDAIKDGDIGNLILCLCSMHQEIRLQALTNLRTFSSKLQPSTYSEWQQAKLLLGEILETANDVVRNQRFPTLAGVLGARLLLVLDDPMHVLYEKSNLFLIKQPKWTMGKLPTYWLDNVLYHPPTKTNQHDEETAWLVDALSQGLQTAEDLEIYRHCKVFERLLGMLSLPKKPKILLDKTMDLLFRSTAVGGSSTLVTRYGIISWLSAFVTQTHLESDTKNRLKVLFHHLTEMSDKEKILGWTDGITIE